MSKVISILAKFSPGLDCGPLRLSVDPQTSFLHQPTTVFQSSFPEWFLWHRVHLVASVYSFFFKEVVFQQLPVIFPGGKWFRKCLGPLCILRVLQWEDQAGTELSPWLLCVTRTFPGWRGRNPYADALRVWPLSRVALVGENAAMQKRHKHCGLARRGPCIFPF